MKKFTNYFNVQNVPIIACVCFFLLNHRNLEFKNIDHKVIIGLISEIAGMIIFFSIINFVRAAKIHEAKMQEAKMQKDSNLKK